MIMSLLSCCYDNLLLQPSLWNTELGFEGGFGVHDYVDKQDGALALYAGNSVGNPITGVVNGLVTDLPNLDGRSVIELLVHCC